MSHEFDITDEIGLDASPEEVWQAIATGPGIDSWYMGRTEIEPHQDGTRTLDMTAAVGVVQKSTITAWEPGRRLAFREDDADGSATAVEYLLEGRDGGATLLRFAQHGVLDGDDWEDQYDGMRAGTRMSLEQLAVHLRHFPGWHATGNLFLLGPAVPDAALAWSRFAAALSLTGPMTPGAVVRLAVPGPAVADGVIEFVDESQYVGVRTSHSTVVLMRGYRDALAVIQHDYSADPDVSHDESAWRSWLAAVASPSTS